MFQSLLALLFTLFLSACSDNASVSIYKQNLPKEKIDCLHLLLSPPNAMIEKELLKLYDFDETCEFRLEVSTKSDIVCNSNYNYQSKAVGSFPSSYLKLQLDGKSGIIYSYYIDLVDAVSEKDVQKAFSRLEEDLSL